MTDASENSRDPTQEITEEFQAVHGQSHVIMTDPPENLHDPTQEITEQFEAVPDCRTLKTRQTTALSSVTRKRTELTALMDSTDNIHMVKVALDEYNERFALYRQCYLLHQESISNEDELHREAERYETKEASFLAHRNQVQEWVANIDSRLAEDLNNTARKNASHHSGSIRSHSSRSSCRSIVSERTMAKALLAELLAEKALKDKEIDIERQRVQLQLDIKIAKVSAREKVLAEAELDNVVEIREIGQENIVCKKQLPNFVNDDTHDALHVNGPDSNVEYVHDVNVMFNNPPQLPLTSQVSHATHSGALNNHNSVTYHNVHSNAGHNVHTNTFHPTRSSVTNPLVTNTTLNPHAQEYEANTVSPNIISLSDVHLQIRDIASAISLPSPDVPTFTGDHTEYNAFMLGFDTRISPRTVHNSDRLYYLHQYVKGEPRELIDGCMHMSPDAGYQEARRLLQQEYGDPYKITNSYLNILLDWMPIRNDDSVSLKRLSFFLIKCRNAMESIPDLGILNHIPNLQIIIGKLPLYLQNKWREEVAKLRTFKRKTPRFSDVVSFVLSAAEAANDSAFSKEALDNVIRVQRNKPLLFAGKTRTASFAIDIDATPHRSNTQNSDVDNDDIIHVW